MRRACFAVLFVVALSVTAVADDSPDKPIEERWDFYFARINDADASVLLDMALKQSAPLSDKPTLLYVLLDMKAPDKHRMGTVAEAGRLMKVEADVTQALQATMGARNVARIRGEALWQLYYYAPSDKELEERVKRAVSQHAGQTFRVGSKQDPEWTYYTGFLYPGPERLRWMRNRGVVDRLLDSGDLSDVPRKVEHWAMFPDKAKRKAFEATITLKKFVVVKRLETKDQDSPFLLHFAREDTVDLRHIHAMTEFLHEEAVAAGGVYDGWESPVVKSRPSEESQPEEKPPAKNPRSGGDK